MRRGEEEKIREIKIHRREKEEEVLLWGMSGQVRRGEGEIKKEKNICGREKKRRKCYFGKSPER